MSCWQTIQDYGLRSIGIGERLLPRTDITLCDQFTLIASGMIWNIYFAVLALGVGFFLATALALAKNSRSRARSANRRSGSSSSSAARRSSSSSSWPTTPSSSCPRSGVTFTLFGAEFDADTRWLTRAWAGALIVLILNTAAYSAEIFYGALRAIPRGDLDAADAYGFTGWARFRKIVWPTMLRLAWPAYTNEAIFLYHATALVFFSGFPAWQQQGDALYYASYFAERTYNPFVPYPIVAFYFICITLLLVWAFGRVNRHLNRHLPQDARTRIRLRPQFIR